jgi:hypothetical protein
MLTIPMTSVRRWPWAWRIEWARLAAFDIVFVDIVLGKKKAATPRGIAARLIWVGYLSRAPAALKALHRQHRRPAGAAAAAPDRSSPPAGPAPRRS